MNHRLMISGLVALLAGAIPAAAQATKPDDPFAQALFDPKLVLQFSQQIKLSDAQRGNILKDLKATQLALAPYQADMTEPSLELVELLGQPRVDEARVAAKMDQVLRIENEVKKTQIALLVRIKNLLTPEQQMQLRELRKAGADEARR